MRRPVWSESSSRTTERKSGTAKKMPACTMYCEKNIVRPPTRPRLRSSAGRSSGSPPIRTSRFSHRMKTKTTSIPSTISQIEGEAPRSCGAPGLGTTQPHSLVRSTPYTTEPRPTTDNNDPT